MEQQISQANLTYLTVNILLQKHHFLSELYSFDNYSNLMIGFKYHLVDRYLFE